MTLALTAGRDDTALDDASRRRTASGTIDGMKATIDEAGRLTLPQEVCEAAGLAPGMELEVRIRDGAIELQRETTPRRLVQKGYVTVLSPVVPIPPLTAEMVEEVREAIRREREGLA